MTTITIELDYETIALINQYQLKAARVIDAVSEGEETMNAALVDYRDAATELAFTISCLAVLAANKAHATPAENKADVLLNKAQNILYAFRCASRYDNDLKKITREDATNTPLLIEVQGDEYLEILSNAPDEEISNLNVGHIHTLAALHDEIDLYLNPIPF